MNPNPLWFQPSKEAHDDFHPNPAYVLWSKLLIRIVYRV